MTFTNADVKFEAMKKGVRIYELAPVLGLSSASFNRKLAFELSDEEKEKMLKAIDEIAKSRAV